MLYTEHSGTSTAVLQVWKILALVHPKRSDSEADREPGPPALCRCCSDTSLAAPSCHARVIDAVSWLDWELPQNENSFDFIFLGG